MFNALIVNSTHPGLMHEIVLDKQYVTDVMCVLSVAVAFNHSMFCNTSVSEEIHTYIYMSVEAFLT